MRFSFDISHVPGKSFVVADALSKAPSSESTADDQLLQEEADTYIQTTSLQQKDDWRRLESQQQDEVCQKVVEYCKTGWPGRSRLSGVIKQFYPVSSELCVEKGLLLRGNRLVIPAALCPRVLKQLHEGHPKDQKV